jgi:hypothetical protein
VLPVLLTSSRNDEVPGTGSTCTDGVSWAVRPLMTGTVTAAEALSRTSGLASDRANALRSNVPGTAKLTAPVVIVTTREAPGASVT